MTTTTTPTAELRRATQGDLARVEQLLTVSGLPLDGVAESLDTFIVAEHDGTIVGVAGLECCSANGLLRSVAVRDEWRSRGLGRSLVTRVIADAESKGMNALYLLTTTAEGYFPSFGFAPVTREAVPADVKATAEFQGACPASASVMELSLGGATS
ncbi:MAG: GCN5-related N-acetyltransferase [Gemmatimonadetes bacterium]|nr:GCN5-related N-acetyltransferase [Gemmatimonadota bacterium]